MAPLENAVIDKMFEEIIPRNSVTLIIQRQNLTWQHQISFPLSNERKMPSLDPNHC